MASSTLIFEAMPSLEAGRQAQFALQSVLGASQVRIRVLGMAHRALSRYRRPRLL
jgi:hypothetical protein